MALKFAVVREDPDLESELLRRTRGRAALVVCSGGCTALTLKARFAQLEVCGFDINADQIAHVRDKAAAVARGDLAALNVGSADATMLNQRGEFEGLFRLLRHFLNVFVAPPAALFRFFDVSTPDAERQALLAGWTASPYFPVAFELAFHDALLNTMFGPAATQHAQPGSYPRYFREVFLRGLAHKDAARNPFLQHILLGMYQPDCAPAYAHAQTPLAVELVLGSLPEVPNLERFDLYSLSNVLDWSDDALCADWAAALCAAARPGAAVLIRQLNNRRDVRRFFTPAFAFDDALGADLLARDRSLFYERIEVGFRVAAP